MTVRERALAEARLWIGTPYRAQASARGQGADCLGLVRGVWRAVCGMEPERPPAYTESWAERLEGGDPLLEAARRRLIEVSLQSAAPGDVLLFRYAPGLPVKHCAILSRPLDAASPSMIHAHAGRAVADSALVPWWRRRIAAAFSFPQVMER